MILEIVFGLGALGIFILFWGSISPLLVAAIVGTVALGPMLWVGILQVFVLIYLYFVVRVCKSSRFCQELGKSQHFLRVHRVTRNDFWCASWNSIIHDECHLCIDRESVAEHF